MMRKYDFHPFGESPPPPPLSDTFLHAASNEHFGIFHDSASDVPSDTVTAARFDICSNASLKIDSDSVSQNVWMRFGLREIRKYTLSLKCRQKHQSRIGLPVKITNNSHTLSDV
jgi:hypothetical protein